MVFKTLKCKVFCNVITSVLYRKGTQVIFSLNTEWLHSHCRPNFYHIVYFSTKSPQNLTTLTPPQLYLNVQCIQHSMFQLLLSRYKLAQYALDTCLHNYSQLQQFIFCFLSMFISTCQIFGSKQVMYVSHVWLVYIYVNLPVQIFLVVCAIYRRLNKINLSFFMKTILCLLYYLFCICVQCGTVLIDLLLKKKKKKKIMGRYFINVNHRKTNKQAKGLK